VSTIVTFRGDSYGQDSLELQRRRDSYRIRQYAFLRQDVQSTIRKYNGHVNIIIAGDFSSDSDQLNDFPEASQAVEELVPGGGRGAGSGRWC
jgi:hypothetical protein